MLPISSGGPKTMDGDDLNISQLKFLIVHTSFNCFLINHDLIIASDLTKTKIVWQPNNKLVIKWL